MVQVRPVLQDARILYGLLRKTALHKEMYIFQDQGQRHSFLYLQLRPVDCAWYIEDY